MINELLFIVHALFITASVLFALWFSQQALIALICVQCILANLFVVKQTSFFGLTATCSDAFTIGTVIGLNLLQEYYGKATAQRTVWLSFFLLMFYAAATHIHCLYVPVVADTMHPAYAAIFTHMPRIVAASFLVYLVVQLLDTWFFARLRSMLGARYLTLRIVISVATCQLLDTVLFSFFGLYGILDNIGHIILISYGIKLLALAVSAPLVQVAKKLITP